MPVTVSFSDRWDSLIIDNSVGGRDVHRAGRLNNSYECFSHSMEKERIEEQSNYDLRAAYLQALKQFMTTRPGSSSGIQTNKEIDAYLGYEKRFSSQLQDVLNHDTSGALNQLKGL